jgi:ornithine cyclodeaminase/alanine dehydrogenase-like protein (mu-crystallin family)
MQFMPNDFNLSSIKGRIHALGMLSYFPNFFSSVNLWNRTKSRAEKLRDELKRQFPGLSINVHDNPILCVEDADVIVTATNSNTALFSSRDLKKASAHINGELCRFQVWRIFLAFPPCKEGLWFEKV